VTEQASKPHVALSGETPGIDADLDKLQRDTFGYLLHETNPANGLVIDKTAEGSPASIAATGLALAAYPVGVERGFISRSGTVGNPYGWWVSPWHCGLNQGPIILMSENYRSGLLCQLMRKWRYISSGLRRAGFEGGWL
jgi:hypothetical protein